MSSSLEDLSMQVALVCPTCGCTEFVYEKSGSGKEYSDDWPFTCLHCGKTVTHAQLLEANSESIDAAAEDMKESIIAKVKLDLRRSLKGKGWKIR